MVTGPGFGKKMAPWPSAKQATCLFIGAFAFPIPEANLPLRGKESLSSRRKAMATGAGLKMGAPKEKLGSAL